jgi:hypothetical protein
MTKNPLLPLYFDGRLIDGQNERKGSEIFEEVLRALISQDIMQYSLIKLQTSCVHLILLQFRIFQEPRRAQLG